MSEQSSYVTNHAFVDSLKAKPREKLFECVVGHDRWLCELVDRGKWSVDVQWWKNEEFHHSRRFDRTEHDLTLARQARNRK